MTSSVLVARDAELAGLEQRLLQAGGAVVLVTGAPGVGRSALMRQLVTRHQGLTRMARASSWETDHEHAVLHMLFPDLRLPESPLDAAAVLAELTPKLVVIDDAHWADVSSVQILTSVVRHHRERGPVVVLTAPTREVPELLHQAADVHLRLRSLDAPAVAELATSRGVLLHPSMAERLWRYTGGLPRHVLDLLDEVPRATWSRFDPELPAPSAVESRTWRALNACSGPARAITEAVAVLGPETPLRDAAGLAGLDQVLEALAEAEANGLLSVTGSGSAWVSPLDPMVRAAVLATLGRDTAAAAHRRAAALVDNPVRRLRHLVAATPMPDTALADELEAAAAERADVGGWADAASLLADASRLTEDRQVRERRLTRAVDALIGAGEALSAAALAPEVESLRETPLRNAVLGYLAVVRGRATEAETRLGRAWNLVNAEREPDVAAMICQRHVLHSLARCRGADLVGWADRALRLVEPDSPAAIESVAIRGLGLGAIGRHDEALAGYRELGERVRHGAQTQRVVMGRGWLELTMDLVEDARADLESAVPTTFLGGSTRISLWARAWLARIQFLTGDWDAAMRSVQEGQDIVGRSGMLLIRPLLQWTAVQIHSLRGQWGPAEQASRLAEAGPRDYEIMRVPSCLAGAQVAEARADYAGVLRALAPLVQPWARECVDEPGAWPWADVYANALVIEGRLDEAEEFLAQQEELARARHHRSTMARLGYARGRLLGARGDITAATEVFEKSLDLLGDLPLRYDRARVNFAYGQTLRRAGKRREADAVISAARDGYLALGADTYVARCDRELKAGGVHVARTERAAGELTPQEEAVAQLVVQGLSNREVAAELFLSTKTVQYHLTRMYTKLGVRSRTELAALRASST